MAEVKLSAVYYRVRIERVEPTSVEQRKEWADTVRSATNQPWNQNPPREIVTEALAFDADEHQFAAIRSAALESMK